MVSLQYQYNEYGWLFKVKAKLENGDSSTLREYLYNSDGKIREIRDYPEFAVNPSGHYMSKRYEFDDLMRVTHMEYRSSLQPDRIRESYDYAYDKNSNIISESIKNDWSTGAEGRANEVRTHTYDARGRLVFTEIQDRLKNDSKIITYTYDSVGNRLSEWDGATQTSYTYNSLNQMTGSEKNVTGNVTSQTAFVYDPNGNLIKETDSVKNRETTYTYDVENRLDQVTVKSNGSTALDQKNVYNGEGQRVQKTENGSVTKYYYQDGAVQHTTDGEGNKTSFHLLGLENQVIMSGRYDGAYAGKYYQYNRDIRGSITDILDQEDNCQVSYKYSDFGETQRYGVQDFYNEICYSGGIYDESTELYYLNARYYDPESGRFLSQDTYRGETDEEETWNLYAYCANNPVKYVDPSGHVVAEVYIAYVLLYLVAGSTVTVSYLHWKNMSHTTYNGVRISRYEYKYKSRAVSETIQRNIPSSSAVGSGIKTVPKSPAVPSSAAGVQGNKRGASVAKSKGGKQRVIDSRHQGKTSEELEAEKNAPGTSKKERKKLEKSLKGKAGRGAGGRNEQRKESKFNHSKGKTKKKVKIKKPKKTYN